MHPLGRRVERCGFEARYFDYPSIRATLSDHADALARFVDAVDSPVVHLVGHSFGGLVILRYLQDRTDLRPGRAVLLGSPLAGSGVARRFAGSAFGRWLLGRAVEPLMAGAPPLDGSREVGVVAGDVNCGLGRLIGGLGRPGDGMVAVAETRLPGITDHLTLSATHMTLLVLPTVARQVCAFLRDGRFSRSGIGNMQPGTGN